MSRVCTEISVSIVKLDLLVSEVRIFALISKHLIKKSSLRVKRLILNVISITCLISGYFCPVLFYLALKSQKKHRKFS